MKSAEILAEVHTSSLNENKKIKRIKKDRDINPVSILGTG